MIHVLRCHIAFTCTYIIISEYGFVYKQELILCYTAGWIAYYLFLTQDQQKQCADLLSSRLARCRGYILMNSITC